MCLERLNPAHVHFGSQTVADVTISQHELSLTVVNVASAGLPLSGQRIPVDEPAGDEPIFCQPFSIW